MFRRHACGTSQLKCPNNGSPTHNNALAPPTFVVRSQAGRDFGAERCMKGAAAQKKDTNKPNPPFCYPARSLTPSLPCVKGSSFARSFVRSVQQISHLHVSLVLVVKFGRRFHSIPAFIIINAIGFSKGASHVSKRHVWGGRDDAAYQYVASLSLAVPYLIQTLFSVLFANGANTQRPVNFTITPLLFIQRRSN